MFPDPEEASVTVFPVQDATQTPLSLLHQILESWIELGHKSMEGGGGNIEEET